MGKIPSSVMVTPASCQSRRIVIIKVRELLFDLRVRWRNAEVLRWRRRLIWFYQRGKRGYADCDVWNLDQYVAGVLAAGMRDLATAKVGWPSFVYGTPEEYFAELKSLADWMEWYAQDSWWDLRDKQWAATNEQVWQRVANVWETLWN